jgi:hypothetical protein
MKKEADLRCSNEYQMGCLTVNYLLHLSPINTWSWPGAGALFLHNFLVLSLQWTLLLSNLP